MRRHAARRLAAVLALVGGAVLLRAGPDTPSQSVAAANGKRVLVVPIHGEINRVQGAFLHRTLKDVGHVYDAVLFELDTPGGRVDIMAKMSQEIVSLKPVPTYTFVKGWAWSAGAFIAMSADEIYMTPTSSIGAAKPFAAGPDGMPVQLPEALDEKITSALRAQFRALAETKGYSAAIAEAMVDQKTEVKRIEFAGEVRYLTGNEFEDLIRVPGNEAKIGKVKTVARKGELLTLTAGRAEEYDLAKAVVDDLDGVLERTDLAGARVDRVEQNWSDKLVAILTSPQIVGLLVLVGFGAIWLELKMPGFGIPGTIGVIAFLLVFGPQFLVGNANALEIMVFVVGLALLAIELFVTPGFGFIGGAGIACIVASLILAMQPFTVPDTPWQVDMLKANLLATLGGIGGSLLALMILAWLLPTTPMFHRLTLRKQFKPEAGFTSGVPDGDALVGQVGTVVTALRPAGKLEIGESTYSVVSDAEFVDAGRRARVLDVDGPRIIVEPLEKEKPAEPEFKA